MPVNDFILHPLSWQPDAAALSRPRYLSLAAKLANDIESGALPPGTCLPPQRELADWLDINFTTITRAYNICRERGLVYGVTGRGTFVSPPIKQTKDEFAKTIDLSAVQCFPELGENVLVETARDILNRDYTRQLFSYGERSGAAHHRSAGAFWISRLGTKVKAENTIVFPGVHNALVTIMLAFFDIGDTIAVDEFTYGNLIDAARFARVRLLPIPGDEEGMLPEALKKCCSREKIKGVFLMPTCANPTTATMSSQRKDAIASIIGRYNILVLEDDSTLVPDGSGTFFERLPDQTFHLTGSTRFLASGLRVSFVLSPAKLFDKLVNALHRLTIKASAFDAEILSELILSGRAEKLLTKKINRAQVMNGIFSKTFPDEKRNFNDPAFFRTITIPSMHRNGPEIERELLHSGVRICHSYRFAARKNPRKAFLRISLSSTNSTSDFTKALKIIRNWLNTSMK